MSSLDRLPEYCPENLSAWRAWLRQNHQSAEGIWLVYCKAGTPNFNISYAEAVEEALCWGWIDSKIQPLDKARYRQVFTPRKPKSVWSALNKRRVEALEAAGRMQPAGRAVIDVAIANGSWTTLDAVESLQMPPDLSAAMDALPEARRTYDAFTPGNRKRILYRLNGLKREETRRTRIAEICEALNAGKMPF